MKLDSLTKKYHNNIIINQLSLDIHDGEFFTILGPSGCGKTTLLNMIAGFTTIDEGKITDKGLSLNNLDASERNIAMVFQEDALFPHLTVKDNILYGLNKPKDIDEYLELMHIKHLENTKVKKLSGGEKQRVSIARALVCSPRILLMDEPLSSLDEVLKIELRHLIKTIQKKYNITLIYVTHDQKEAMELSDRIAIIKDGVIQQVGSACDLYYHPVNDFVASFIGEVNVIDGFYIRPEDIHEDINGERGKVIDCIFLGSYYRVLIDFKGQIIKMNCSSYKENGDIYISLKYDKIVYKDIK